MTEKASNNRVALVIGSGGVKCAAALGLQHALAREGIGLDMVVGCSGGSMYAALAALGFSLEEAQEATLKLWTREATAKRNRRALLQMLFPRWFGFSAEWGLRDDHLVMERFRQGYGNRTFADTQIPLYVTATDFTTGEQVVLSSGPIAEAVRASIAIPFIFKPFRLNGRLLVDGFLSDPLPVNVAMREGANVIVAMGFESPNQPVIKNPWHFAFQFSSIMTNSLLKSRFAFHSAVHHAEVIPVVPVFEKRVRVFDTGKLPYVIEQGARAAEEHIPYIRRLLASATESPPS
jgi:NTE family protein